MNKKMTPEEFESAYLSFRQKSKADADRYLQEVLASSFKNPQVKQYAHYIRGLDLFFAMHYEEAQAQIAPFILSCLDYPFKPFYIDCINLAGMIAAQEDRNYLAIFYYKQALALADEKKALAKLPMLYSNLSTAYIFIGDNEKALQCQESALAYLSPHANPLEKINYLFNKAITLKNLGRAKEAQELLGQVEKEGESHPLDPTTLTSIAFLKLEIDDALKDDASFEKHLAQYYHDASLAPIDVYSLSDYEDLTRLFFGRGDQEKMLECFHKIEAVDAKAPQLSTKIFLASFRGRYYEKQGDYKKSSEQYALASSLQKERGNAIAEELEKMISLHFDFVKLSKAYEKAKRRNHRLSVASTTDPLTGLYNRNALEKDEKRLWQKKKESPCFTCALLDFDSFKSINDTYGHLVGDKVLSAGGAVFKSFQSASFKAYRFGGDEFLLLFSPLSPEDALLKLKNIQLQMAGLAVTSEKGERIPLSVSAGYLCLIHADKDLHTCLELADQKLMEAKHLGKNRIQGLTL
jgi:diguanylate cyclase (GGDEF)-like protein